MKVQELSREQLDELKSNYLWDMLEEVYQTNKAHYHFLLENMDWNIADDIVFKHYKDTDFCNEDFWCSAGN